MYSAPLTKFSVTGLYEVHPGILRNKMSTQQSSWMEMALEDGHEGSLERWWRRGGVGRWGWAAVENCSGSISGGGGRRTCDNGIGISIVEAEGLLFWPQHQHQQRWQERMRRMQGTYIGSNGKDIGVSQRRWQWWQCRYNNSASKARARG